MNEIRALLRAAARRIETTTFVAVLNIAVVAAAAVALALAVADRLPSVPFVPWMWVAPALGAAGIAAAIAMWSRKRRSEIEVALAVDLTLDLRERLSTALHCSGRDDAFAQAAVEDAVHTASDPRVRERMRRLIRVSSPRRWWVGPAIVAVTVAVLLLVPQGPFVRSASADEIDERETAAHEAGERVEAVISAVESSPELEAEIAGLVDELRMETPEAPTPKEAEAFRRESLKKVTELSRRLDELVSGEKGQTERSMREMLAKLETPDSGPAKELAEALARGDFAEAKKALEKMVDEAAASMNDEQRAQLGQQLDQLAQQLDQLAQQQAQLQQALQQAGLNPQLANNQQALQQALQQAQNLNEEQRQQLQQMCQAQQQAQQMCQGLGGACKQMAQGLAQGSKPGQGQGGAQQMADQLDQLEQLQQMLRQAQAVAGQCQGNKPGQGMSQSAMGGMGNRGQGSGGKAPISPTPTGTQLRKANAPVGEGEIIFSMIYDGAPIKGESKAKLRDVLKAAASGYDEAQAEENLPRQYHDAIQHYFGELSRRVEASPAADGDGEATKSAAPGEGAAGSGGTGEGSGAASGGESAGGAGGAKKD